MWGSVRSNERMNSGFLNPPLGSLCWQVYLAQFVPNDNNWMKTSGKFLPPKSAPSKGVWIKTEGLVTLTIMKRVDSRTSTISLINGPTFVRKGISILHNISSWQISNNLFFKSNVQEQHYISTVLFALPEIQSESDTIQRVTPEPGRSVLCYYYDENIKKVPFPPIIEKEEAFFRNFIVFHFSFPGLQVLYPF